MLNITDTNRLRVFVHVLLKLGLWYRENKKQGVEKRATIWFILWNVLVHYEYTWLVQNTTDTFTCTSVNSLRLSVRAWVTFACALCRLLKKQANSDWGHHDYCPQHIQIKLRRLRVGRDVRLCRATCGGGRHDRRFRGLEPHALYRHRTGRHRSARHCNHRHVRRRAIPHAQEGKRRRVRRR